MSKFYESMPQEFKNAVEVIKNYCQFEDCDEVDCNQCPYPLSTIRQGDTVAYEKCGNMEDYYNKEYECIEEFTLPFYDEYMNTTEEYGTIGVGSVWEVSDDNSEGDIRLNNISGSSDFPWIDISFKHLKGCFKQTN